MGRRYGDGKDLTGILAAVDDGSVSANYGGIDRGTYGFWKSQVTDATGKTFSLSMVNQMITRCTDGTDRPDMIVTTPEIWDALWDLFQQQQRYKAEQVADTGFDTIRFRGIDIMFDRYAPEGRMYFFNTKYSPCVRT